MSREPVTREDVGAVAKSLLSPTFAGVLGLGGYTLLVRMIRTEGLMQEFYIEEGLIIVRASILVLFTILTFAWGFVGYLYMQYRIDEVEQ